MKYLPAFLAALLLLHPITIFGQTSPNAEKMLQQLKKQIASDPDMDPEERARLLKVTNSKAMQEKAQKADRLNPKQMKIALQADEKLTGLPKPDAKRLAAIPKSPWSAGQVDQYLGTLYTRLAPQLTESDRNGAAKIIHDGSSSRSTTLAVMMWYHGNAGGALLLAIKAAQAGKDPVALNNLAAMLDESGFEEKAIRLLQYALTKDSTNPSLLNNMGRAYLGLGDKSRAKKFLLMCVAHAPNHPEANNSLGCLYESEENIPQAEAHYRQSIAGSYNENAYRHLIKLQPDVDIVKLVAHHDKAPEYFNQFAIELPPECTNVDERNLIQKEHEIFQRKMDELSEAYDDPMEKANQENEEQLKAMQDQVMSRLAEGQPATMKVSPLFKLASIMLVQLDRNWMKDSARVKKDYARDMTSLLQSYKEDTAKMSAEWKSQYKMGPMGECGICCLNCEEVNRRMCRALKELANSYQRKAADRNMLFRKQYRRILLDYFDQFLYWKSLSSLTKAGADYHFYETINNFLSELKYLSSTTPFITEYCEPVPGKDLQVSEGEGYSADKKPFCPFSVDIPLVIGKMSFDCTSFSISGGEIVKGSYKKDFVSGQTTLSIGAGLSADIGIGKTGASAGVGESIYVTFDANGQPSDVGIKMDAGGSINIGNISTGANAGYTVGMNSGWDFTASGAGRSFHL